MVGVISGVRRGGGNGGGHWAMAPAVENISLSVGLAIPAYTRLAVLLDVHSISWSGINHKNLVPDHIIFQ